MSMRSLLLIIKLLLSAPLFGQYYHAGNSPARLRWQQIETPAARLVFEKGFAQQALQLAAFMDSVAPLVGAGMRHRPPSIDLLLHNHTAYANGFVTWAPRRSEWFTLPPQQLQPTPWLQHLALHEYRHVVQIDQLNRGFTKGLSWLLGQQAVGGVLGAYVPMWLLEGDAILAETTLSESGRGRSHAFNAELKAQLLEKGRYSYEKAYLGSYRDYVPDYYKMGYLMVSKGREWWGPPVWEQTLKFVGRRSWHPRAFERGLKRQTDMGQRELYQKTFDDWTKQWRAEAEHIQPSSFLALPVVSDDYRNYRWPVAVDSQRIVAEVEGPGLRRQIQILNEVDGTANTLLYLGWRAQEALSANEQGVVWTELRQHPRWEQEVWSELWHASLETGQRRRLSSKTRYFSPALHPEKAEVAVVEAHTDLRFALVVLDLESGRELQRFAAPEHCQLLTPRWNAKGNGLLLFLQGPEGRALHTLNLNTGHWQQVLPWSHKDFRNPVQQGDSIWFTGPATYNDEIFLLSGEDAAPRVVTQTDYGADYANPTPEGGLLYSRYTAQGYRVSRHLQNAAETNTANASALETMARLLTEQEKQIQAELPPADSTSTKEYTPRRYSKWNILQLHSWAPAFVDLEGGALYTGITAFSQNLLGTTFVSAGYNANPAHTHERFQLRFDYRGFYPLLSLRFQSGYQPFEEQGFLSDEQYFYYINSKERVNQRSLKAGISLPHDFSRGPWSRHLQASLRFSLQQRQNLNVPLTQYRLAGNELLPTGITLYYRQERIDFKGLDYTLSLRNIRRGSSRDAATRMGQAVSLFYRHAAMGSTDNGSIGGLMSRVYLPGPGKHDALYLSADFQKRTWGEPVANNEGLRYRQSNVINYPRGYDFVPNDKMWLLSANYQFPLWLPDVRLGKLAYIKRLRMNMFYDQSFSTYEQQLQPFSINVQHHLRPASTGLELFADTHLLRFISPFSIGGRAGCTSEGDFFGGFIFSSALSGFLVNQ